MDDEFELVSKDFLKNLKEENKILKEKLENININKFETTKKIQDKETLNILLKIKEENTEKNQEIIKLLRNLKELNEKNVTQNLNKTEKLENNISEIIFTMKNLIKSVEGVVENISENQKNIENQKNSKNIENKLEEINLFMVNLKKLLSSVKSIEM